MPLLQFILLHLEAILAAWEAFARTQQPEGADMTALELRDHAESMLRTIARGMDAEGAQAERRARDPGTGAGPLTAASRHGGLRQLSGFSLVQLNAEFRALRATVLRLWLPQVREFDEATTRELVRFNEMIDLAVAESLVNYAARAASSRDTFLAILGHDLRSPLQTIAIAGDYLGRPGIGSDETREVAARVRRSAATIDAMVRDLLEYARGQLGCLLPLQASPGDLGVLCGSVVGDLGATWPDCKFELSLEGDLAGCFDRHRIEQALTNLLTNLGLGLFIARQIALSHHGSLNASSSEADGTVFSLRLPRKGPVDAKAA